MNVILVSELINTFFRMVSNIVDEGKREYILPRIEQEGTRYFY